jgi:hypothetical protein
VNGLSEGIQVTWVNEGQLVATLPASYLEQGGVFPLAVKNPYPANAVSDTLLLTVYYPPPAVDNVVPGSCAAKLELDASPLNIEVIGYGFRRGAVVLFDNKPLVTTYCETDAYCLDTHLYAQVPAALLRSAGFGKIEVRNPSPSLTLSEAMYLRIDGLRPSITAVQPGSASLTDVTAGFSMPVIVDGINFGAQTTVIIGQVGDDPEGADGKAQVLSSTSLLAAATMKYPDALGEWWIMACNPPPGGGCSERVSFYITEASFMSAPFLTSLSPGSVSPGSRSFTLTVNGSNFKSGAVVNFRSTPLMTTFVSKTQLRVTVPASLIRIAGKIPISVTNPDTSGTSNKLFLDVK